MAYETLAYSVDGRVARIELNRPERGNAITLQMPRELADAVERADLNPAVHVIALSGRGAGFCAGYDLLASAEQMNAGAFGARDQAHPDGVDDGIGQRAVDGAVIAKNHQPGADWDPMVDYQMMSRNVRGFMSLFHADKPVVTKVHGFCVAGGTDMALCSDLVIAEDIAKIGYPPARVWGVPTSALWAHRVGVTRAKRLLFTGDSISGREAVEWGLAIECAPAAELDARFEVLLGRIAQMPINQLIMMKLMLNQTVHAMGLYGARTLGTVFDGIARHTPEGHGFAMKAAASGFKAAVQDRDGPFGDVGRSTFKG